MEAFEAIPIIGNRAKDCGIKVPNNIDLATAMDSAKQGGGRCFVSASPIVVDYDGQSYHFLVDLGSYNPTNKSLV